MWTRKDERQNHARRLAMPRILITADGSDGHEMAIVLQERVIPSDLESDHFSAQLIERMGWALVDADEIEHRAPALAAGPARRMVLHESTETQSLRAA
jgi:hypothetical protein